MQFLCFFCMCNGFSCCSVFLIWRISDNFKKYLTSESIHCLLSRHVFGLLSSPTLGIGFVCFESLFTRDRREIYTGCLICTWAPMFYTFVASNSDLIDSYTTHYMLKVNGCMHTMYSHTSYNTVSMVINHYFCLIWLTCWCVLLVIGMHCGCIFFGVHCGI